MYKLVLPNDLKKAAAVEKRKKKIARSNISIQKRTLSTFRGNCEHQRSILGTTGGFDTSTDLRMEDIAQETCISDDVSTCVSQKTEEQFDFYPPWSGREEKRWYHRTVPSGTWETTSFDHLTEAPFSCNQDLLLHRQSSVKEMASTSSKSRHPTYISSVLRNGDGSRRNSIFDIFAKQYTSQKSRLVTTQGKTKHPTTRVHSPENVDKRRGSLLITLAESTLLASCTVARQTSIDQKENSVNYSAAVIRQDAQIKPVAKLSVQRTPVYNQPSAIGTLQLKTEVEENVHQKTCSTAEEMSDRVSGEVEQVNSKLQLNEGVLGVSNCLEALMKADGDDRLSVAILHDCGDTTSPLEDQESNHLDDLHTNTLISQSVQMNPVKIEADKKQFQTMWKRTESTLDKDTFTIVSLRVSSDSNSTLHSDTSSQVFPTEEDVQAQVV